MPLNLQMEKGGPVTHWHEHSEPGWLPSYTLARDQLQKDILSNWSQLTACLIAAVTPAAEITFKHGQIPVLFHGYSLMKLSL